MLPPELGQPCTWALRPGIYVILDRHFGRVRLREWGREDPMQWAWIEDIETITNSEAVARLKRAGSVWR